MSEKKELSSGEEVDSRCLKCKDVTNHTIIAMVEGEIAKVECNVCNARHKYRAPLPPKTKRKSTAAAQKASAKPKMGVAARNANERFNKLLNGRAEDASAPYSMTSLFGNDEVVRHPTFGVGVVTANIPPNKIELTFAEGPKVFVCKATAPTPLNPDTVKKKTKKKLVRSNVKPMI